ncbi:MAG: dihydroorotase [Azonexus sp.]
MNIEIRNGRVIDPKNGIDQHNLPVFISGRRIVGVGAAPAGFEASESIDAQGHVVCPGFVDLGARLNSIEAELAAAVAGGVTSVVVPPDADPPLDEPELADRLVHRAKEIGKARVYPLGALTLGLKGERLTEMAGLKKAGCVAFSQAKAPVVDTQSLMHALEYAASFGFTVFLHPQDHYLARGGNAHDGEVAARLGLSGIPVAAETIAIATLTQLVRHTGCRVHLTRLSSAAGVAMVEAAMAEGLPLSFDIGIHHLLLTEHDIGFFNPQARFLPPLRTQQDRAALSQAAGSGQAAICSDHTPLAADDKMMPFGEAKSGATGLETLLPLTLKWAAQAGISLPAALARITCAPAAILGLAAGTLDTGASADICIFDPEEEWLLTPEILKSRGKNSPWLGHPMQGRVRKTLVGGRVVHG